MGSTAVKPELSVVSIWIIGNSRIACTTALLNLEPGQELVGWGKEKTKTLTCRSHTYVSLIQAVAKQIAPRRLVVVRSEAPFSVGSVSII